MSCTQLTDGKISTPIQPTLRQPVGPKSVIYNVPLDIKADEILNYLPPQVRFVKRFQYKPAGELELHDSTTVLLHFQSEPPSEVRIGYLLYKIRPYIPKPLRCFKCNRFGHVAYHCKIKERCSKCGEQQVEHVLKIKTSRNVSYAEAVKLQRSSEQGTSPPIVSSGSEYPALPTAVPSLHIICPNLSTPKAVDSNNKEVIVTEEIGSFKMFNNPIHFLAFLAEVMQQTIVAKDQNETIDVFKIITGAAGGRYGLLLDSEQLHNFAMECQVNF